MAPEPVYHAVRRLIPARGVAVNHYDAMTVAVMARVLRRDANALDVGARVGDLLRPITETAPFGAHVAVEPLAMHAATLRRDFPSVTVIEAALGDTTGRSKFCHVVSNDAYSGLRRRPFDRPDEQVATIEVDVRRLDDVWPPTRPLAFVKIDVEGGEVGVIRGGLATLDAHRPVVVLEHAERVSSVYGHTTSDLFAALTEVGYTLFTLPGWLTAEPPLEAREVDEADAYYFVAAPRAAKRA
ncbi:MAG: FkbM family methyltransferase [Actinobacteria bacterium]|nr:FkbM family methyltransferase [Actinomycetota bacterium]